MPVTRPPDQGADPQEGWRESNRPRAAIQRAAAQRLVRDCLRARSREDLARSAAETFLRNLDEPTPPSVLMTFLDLPAAEPTGRVLRFAEQMLARRGAVVVDALLRTAIESRSPARANAATTLEWLPAAELAAGLIDVLAGDGRDTLLKEAAADMLVGIGQPAAAQIFDALAEPAVRPWIVLAAGCRGAATDAQVMRRITGASVAAC
jgi:hypothetical protein